MCRTKVFLSRPPLDQEIYMQTMDSDQSVFPEDNYNEKGPKKAHLGKAGTEHKHVQNHGRF